MTNLPRVTAKIFASNAAPEDIGQYGSAISGTKVTTSDIAEIQALPAYETGWRGAVISNRDYPTLQEMNGLQKTFSQQIAYILQKGIPEYDPNTTYYTSSFCQFNGVLYKSLSNDNTGNQPDTSTAKWQILNFGNSNTSSLPLFFPYICDHTLTGDEAVGWALQGSLITNIYSSAVAKISELYSGGTETEHRGISCKRSTDGRYIADISQKDAIDLLYSETGVAEFYIFDSVNEQFYLPKSKWFMQLTDDTGLVNGYNEAGLPNIAQNFTAPGYSDYASSTLPFNISRAGAALQAGGSTMRESSNWSFNASRASAVYGNSDTVQPTSSNKLLYYKVGNTVVNDDLIDVGNILSELNLISYEINSINSRMTDLVSPDYENKAQRTMNTTYNENVNGFLVFDIADTLGISDPSVTISDHTFLFYQGRVNVDNNHPTTGIFPIPRNTDYSWTCAAGGITTYFVPYKGEN